MRKIKAELKEIELEMNLIAPMIRQQWILMERKYKLESDLRKLERAANTKS